MKNILKIAIHLCLWIALMIAALGYQTGIYIFYQAQGQLNMLLNTQSISEYAQNPELSMLQKQNLELIGAIKKYSVDSLYYKPTKNFNSIYNQGQSPLLWVVTASQKFKIEPYYWSFPVVGEVSYKGFFDKQKAIAEKNRLICQDYDVDLRSVSAWSTLGWFSDPVLSSMLNKSKGNLCNLIFHELFHATYYAKSSVDFNENLASFIAHKATLRFLANDTAALNDYVTSYNDDRLIEKCISQQIPELKRFYDSIAPLSNNHKTILRLKKLVAITRNINSASILNKRRAEGLKKNIMEYKNAWFVDFNQYNGMQDSLEVVFNKIYQSNVAKMVQSLK